jgi:hypothetical protein
MKSNLAAVLALASLASPGCAKPPTLVSVGTSIEIPCPEQQSGFVCTLTQVKPCTVGRPGGQLEISGVIDLATRYADRSNAAYPVPTLVPDEPVCMQGSDRLFGRNPIELVTNDPVLARSLVGLAGQHVKLAGRLSDEVVVTSSQGPTFSLSLSGVVLR